MLKSETGEFDINSIHTLYLKDRGRLYFDDVQLYVFVSAVHCY